MNSSYAGIGSRETPDNILKLMRSIAWRLAEEGWTLRSGHAPGADQAFELGAGEKCEIYLPWPSFEDRVKILGEKIPSPSMAAMEMAKQFHPAWNFLKQGARKLHARNCHQVLGRNLDDPVETVICWTEGGGLKGGTAQALRIAAHHDIKIKNLGNEETLVQALDWIYE